MRKVKIKYSIISNDGCPSRSRELEVPYVGYFDSLVQSMDDAVELFEARQEKYRQAYIKEWGEDPFKEEE